MEMFIASHEDYVYDELLDELKGIHRLGNESVDNFFLRFMHIFHRFPENDKPSDQIISNWFSYLVSDLERCDLDDQIISHSQDLGLVTKDKGYTLHNQSLTQLQGNPHQ
jgi:hypothetical protein